jgi:hypothetical protein
LQGFHFPAVLDILINGKWTRLHDGSTVLPGRSDVRLLSMCGVAKDYPPANPPAVYEFYVFSNSVNGAAGDTVSYTLSSGHYPVLQRPGDNGHVSRHNNGRTCYGALNAYHTIYSHNSRLQDQGDTRINRSALGVPANLVANYLEALGKSDQLATKAFLAADCRGDLAEGFQQKKTSGQLFSGSNTSILNEELYSNNVGARVVADVVFTSGEASFASAVTIFYGSVQESEQPRIFTGSRHPSSWNGSAHLKLRQQLNSSVYRPLNRIFANQDTE